LTGFFGGGGGSLSAAGTPEKLVATLRAAGSAKGAGLTGWRAGLVVPAPAPAAKNAAAKAAAAQARANPAILTTTTGRIPASRVRVTA
jgi:aspartate/methionine/tyrosine aminotransferase